MTAFQKVQKELLQPHVQSKSHKNPVTVADYGSQAVVSIVLQKELSLRPLSLVVEEFPCRSKFMDYSQLNNDLANSHVTDEDLFKMVEDNGYCSMGTPLDAIHQCADGMLFGAITSKCKACGGSLVYLGGWYYCHGNLLKKSQCGYSSRDAVRSKRKWKISSEIKNKYLVDWRQKMRLEKNLCPLRPTEKRNKKFILEHIMSPPPAELRKTISDWSILEIGGFLYHTTLTPSGSLLEKNCLIYQIVQDGSIFYLYRNETRHDEPRSALYPQLDMQTAISNFESLFYSHTGNKWSSWLNKTFVSMVDKYVPLDIDYVRQINFGSSLEINDVNEELLILPENFKPNFEELKKSRCLTRIDLSILEKLDGLRIGSGFSALLTIHQWNALKKAMSPIDLEAVKADCSHAFHIAKECLCGVLSQSDIDNVDVEQTVKLLRGLEEILMASRLVNLGCGAKLNTRIRFYDLLFKNKRSDEDNDNFENACELLRIFLTDGQGSSRTEITQYCHNGEKLKFAILAQHGSWFLDFVSSNDNQIIYFGELEGGKFQFKVACAVILRKDTSAQGNFVLCTAYVKAFPEKLKESFRVTWKQEPLKGEEHVIFGLQGHRPATKTVGYIDFNHSTAKVEVLFNVSKFSKSLFRDNDSWHWFFKETAKMIYMGNSPHINAGNDFDKFVFEHLKDASLKNQGLTRRYQEVCEKLTKDDFTPQQSNEKKSEILIVWV